MTNTQSEPVRPRKTKLTESDPTLLSIPRAGSFYKYCSPLFTPDSKYLIAACGYQVIVYNTATGEEIAALNHKSEVTCFAVNPFNTCQLYTSNEEEILLWDYLDASLLQKINIKGIRFFLSSRVEDSVLYIFDGVRKGLSKIKLTNDFEYDNRFLIDYNYDAFVTMQISPQNDYLIFLSKTNITTYYIKGNNEKLVYMGYFTSISCHPTERKLAVAQEDGSIRYWNCIPETPFATEQSITPYNIKFQTHDLHWHSRGPTIQHTQDGVYLLSGGREGVLVIWQLSTGKRQFLPGLDAPINFLTLSPDFKYYAAVTKNNKIVVLNSASLSLHQSISGLCGTFTRATPKKFGHAEIDPINNCLVSEGSPGVLQFFNLNTNRISYALVVAKNPENVIQDRTPISSISLFTFSKDKKWLVTIDRIYLHDREVQTLKFWYFSLTTQTYQLNTQIENPHSASITSLSVSSQNDVITTSKDKKFKLWNSKKIEKEEKGIDSKIFGGKRWFCKAVGDYKNMIAFSSSFSTDGSLLAIAFQHVITLWDPKTLSIVKTLSLKFGDLISQVAFLNNSHHLISISKNSINNWDLLSGSVWWTFNHSFQCRIIVDPSSSHFAIYVNNHAKFLSQKEKKIKELKAVAVKKIEAIRAQSKNNPNNSSANSSIKTVQNRLEKDIIALRASKQFAKNYLLVFNEKSPNPIHLISLRSKKNNQSISFRQTVNAQDQSIIVQSGKLIEEFISNLALPVTSDTPLARVDSADLKALQEFFAGPKAQTVQSPGPSSATTLSKQLFPQSSHLILSIESTFETFMSSFFTRVNNDNQVDHKLLSDHILPTDDIEVPQKDEEMVVSVDSSSWDKIIAEESQSSKSYSYLGGVIQSLTSSE